jgi:hypothetical protein
MQHNKRLWGNTDIVTLERMDAARRWFPNARFIHIVRDGRDVALSHDSYVYGASNTLECAERWQLKVHTNLKMGAMLPDTQYLVVRYEDLILDPERVLGRICSYLEIDYSPEMLAYPEMVDSKIPDSRRSLWPLIGQAPKSDNAYRWRSHMSQTRRVVFERTASQLLKRLGYETYAHPRGKALTFLYELFCFMDRGHRVRRLGRAIFPFRKVRIRSEARSR